MILYGTHSNKFPKFSEPTKKGYAFACLLVESFIPRDSLKGISQIKYNESVMTFQI